MRLASPNGAPLVLTGRPRRASLAHHSRGALVGARLRPLVIWPGVLGPYGQEPLAGRALSVTLGRTWTLALRPLARLRPLAPCLGALGHWPCSLSWGVPLAQSQGALGPRSYWVEVFVSRGVTLKLKCDA